jgi:hypothetical protein
MDNRDTLSLTLAGSMADFWGTMETPAKERVADEPETVGSGDIAGNEEVSVYEVQFKEDSLGLVVNETEFGEMYIRKNHNQNSMASCVRAGDIVHSVNDNLVDELVFDEIANILRNVGRPVDIGFRRPGALSVPEMKDISSRQQAAQPELQAISGWQQAAPLEREAMFKTMLADF